MFRLLECKDTGGVFLTAAHLMISSCCSVLVKFQGGASSLMASVWGMHSALPVESARSIVSGGLASASFFVLASNSARTGDFLQASLCEPSLCDQAHEGERSEAPQRQK